MVSAIFLIVILAGLGVAMVNVATVHQTSSALDVQGARAYQAARAGIEWGLYQQLRNGAACTGASSTFQLPAGTTLSGFRVTVTCVLTAGPAVAVTVPPLVLDRKVITATACNLTAGTCTAGVGGGTDFVQRILQVEF
jgi:MSHA biogenesis protein MshP